MEILYRVYPVVLCPYCRCRHMGEAACVRMEHGKISRGAFDASGRWAPGMVRTSCGLAGDLLLPIPEGLFRNPIVEEEE
jgi:hypothetical protein